jgi:hypothetical protein
MGKLAAGKNGDTDSISLGANPMKLRQIGKKIATLKVA